MTSPIPAEWAPHRAMWVGFPSHVELWEDDLAPAQAEVAELVRTLAGPGREHVKLLVYGEAAMAAARAALGDVAGVEIVPGRFGDVWLRDTAPIFRAASEAEAFRFNGWGGKYILEGDEDVAAQVASQEGARLTTHPFVLEGGALDHDGDGTILTTRQCLLNPNRNAGWDERAAETALKAALGATKVIWLDEGLINDHTDGHVDNLARFIGTGVVVCQQASDADDPNAEIYEATAEFLESSTDAAGRRLRVIRVPSPGRVTDVYGRVVPASHMNFVFANDTIIMPYYDGRVSEAQRAGMIMLEAGAAMAFVAHPANALLTGGGSFHCITQQVPA